MNFNAIPSLRQAAAIKIAHGIYHGSDIAKLLQEDRYPPSETEEFDVARHCLWENIRKTISEKLSSFLPKALQTGVIQAVEATHLEAQLWVNDHTKLNLCYSCFYTTYKSIFCWKTDGSIDRLQTAKKFSQNTDIDPNKRFIMACTYFLEDEVLELWNRNKKVAKKSIRQFGTNPAVRFWMKWLEKNSAKPWREMIDDYFTTPCIRESDIVVNLNCIFRYVSKDTRKRYFGSLLGLTVTDFILCINEVDETDREIFKFYPFIMLHCCLRWPYQRLFMDMANQLWEKLGNEEFDAVLSQIISLCVLKGLKDFNYIELLNEFWHQSPDHFKQKIRTRGHYYEVISRIRSLSEDNHSIDILEGIAKDFVKFEKKYL